MSRGVDGGRDSGGEARERMKREGRRPFERKRKEKSREEREKKEGRKEAFVWRPPAVHFFPFPFCSSPLPSKFPHETDEKGLFLSFEKLFLLLLRNCVACKHTFLSPREKVFFATITVSASSTFPPSFSLHFFCRHIMMAVTRFLLRRKNVKKA